MGRNDEKGTTLKSLLLENALKKTTDKTREITNDGTVKNYKRFLGDFNNWVKSEGIEQRYKSLDEVKDPIALVQKYTDSMVEKGCYSPWTIHTKIAPVCKGFGISLKEIDHPQRTANHITRGRITTERVELDRSNSRYERFFTLAKATGIRKSELERLTGKNLVLDESGKLCVEVERGKGGKYQLQRVLPQYKDVVYRIFRDVAPDEKVFKDTETKGKISTHQLRRDLSREAYAYYNKKIQTEDGYKLKLINELIDRYKTFNKNATERDINRFKGQMLSMDGQYHLRGENRKMAIINGRATVYDRVALMAVSVFHESHWRLDVSVVNYMVN